MLNKIEIEIPRVISKYPDASEMKKFAANYTEWEWNRICLELTFRNALLHDLNRAKEIANSILGKEEVHLNPS